MGGEVRAGADGGVVLRTADGNLVRLGAKTTTETRPPTAEKSIILFLREGLAYVLSFDSRELAMETPYANGGPEGTEFEAMARLGANGFAMVDGSLLVASSSQARRIAAGEGASIAPNGVIDARAAPEFVRWAHFPQIIDGALPAPDAEPPPGADAGFFVERAASRLGIGDPAGAMEDLARAHDLDRTDARVDALLAIIALVGGAIDEAAARADAALRLDPDSLPALLASSYVRLQNRRSTQLRRGVAAVQDVARALEREPSSALVHARLAEVYFETGNYAAGADEARQATAIDPTSSYAFAMLGFSHWNALEPAAALEAFERSIELDGMAPLPWIGKALALKQQGQGLEASQAAEIALVLDPTNAVIRGYSARFYVDDNRTELANAQLVLASGAGPSDPSALLALSVESRLKYDSVAALQIVDATLDLNGGVPPSRSSFAPDYDSASQGSEHSRLYVETDTPKIGAEHARLMTGADPLDPVAHGTYAALAALERFGEQTAVDESLLHQLLLMTIPSATTSQRDQLITPGARRFAERNLSPNDLARPLTEDGLDGYLTTVTGSQNTIGASAAVSYRSGQNAFNGSSFRIASDGTRANNDFDERAAEFRFKRLLSPGSSIQLGIGSIDAESGDLYDRFYDPAVSRLRVAESVDSLRIAGRHDQSELNRRHPERRGTWLYSGYFSDNSASTSAFDISGRGSALAVRYLLQLPTVTIDSGWSRAALRGLQVGVPLPSLPSVPPTITRQEQSALYSYATFAVTDTASVTVGLNADWLDLRGTEQSEVNGKLGWVWQPRSDTTVRAAFIESPPSATGSTSRSNLQPSLETARVAGFPQSLFPPSDRNRMRMAAIEHEFGGNVFAGFEARWRSSTRLFTTLPSTVNELGIDERVQSAYLYWLPGSRINVSAVHERDDYQAVGTQVLEFTAFETERTTLDLNFFPGRGLSAGIRATHVRQSGHFSVPGTPAFAPGKDEFTLLDLVFSHRFPDRWGALDLRFENVTDQRFRYQEPESDRVTFLPEANISLTLTIALP